MKAKLFLIETLSNLHVGSGEINYGLVDNLIQRDPVTNLPTINSSSLKGALREHFQKEASLQIDVKNIFGSSPKENNATQRKQGALRFFEADLISIPVRTSGSDLPFVNASTKKLLQRQVERLKQFNINASAFNQLFGDEKAGDVIIEDLPGTKAYFNVATDRIIIAGSNIVLLEESDLEQLCDNEHLPIISRNCLEDGQSTNLFYEQVLPRYSHFATLVLGEEEPLDSFCNSLNNQIVQIGGNATIGYGYCKYTLFSTL